MCRYLEESLKVCCALSEFDKAEYGNTSGPAIVGFSEFCFSGLGTLGAFAAISEQTFGSISQSVMAYPLGSRYHYGHPDMLDKTRMMAQGGISKGTKVRGVRCEV